MQKKTQKFENKRPVKHRIWVTEILVQKSPKKSVKMIIFGNFKSVGYQFSTAFRNSNTSFLKIKLVKLPKLSGEFSFFSNFKFHKPSR